MGEVKKIPSKAKIGAGWIAQWLRTLADLPEDPGSDPSTSILGNLQTAITT